MAEKGGQPGNQNAADGKIWRNALRQALDRRTKSRTDGKAELDALADRLIDSALEGQIPALREFGDRVEGKAAQQVEVTGADGGPLAIALVKYADNDTA